MKTKAVRLLSLSMFSVVFLFATLLVKSADARQTPDVEIELSLLPVLTEAQVLSLAQLGIDTQGAGNRLFNMIIENREMNASFYNENGKLGNLYLSANVRVSGVGMIIQLDTDQPFSLRQNQVVVANNNSMQNGLPGVDERVRANGDLTPEGEQFVNNLKGSTRLPDMVYTITVQLWYGGKRGQGAMISESSVTLPIENLGEDFDIVLVQPGDVIGSNADPLFNRFPVFRWDGDPRAVYRLVVVQKREGQSPESQIQAALSSDPSIIPSGTSLPFAPGNLLEFEMVDAIVRGLAFNYPVGGNVQQLQENETYFWQVFGVLRTPSGIEYQPSDIFEFSIGGTETVDDSEPFVIRLPEFLKDVVGTEVFNLLNNRGFRLQSIRIDGVPMSEQEFRIYYQQQCQDDSVSNRDNLLCGKTDHF